MKRARGLAARVGLLLVSSLLAVFAAEFTIRYWFPAAPQLELDLYQRGNDGNLRLRPGVERRHVTPYWDVGIRINSEGVRGTEPPGDGRPAILGLGDSMSFGWGVESEETYFSLLEDGLREQRPVRVVNASVPGTGTGDQFHLLQTVRRQFQPRAVVLSFFVGNDVVDVQMGGADQFRVENGLLTRAPIHDEQPSFFSWLRTKLVRNSNLLQLVRAVQFNWTRPEPSESTEKTKTPRRWDEWLREFAQIHLKEYPERTRLAFDQTLEYLDRIDAFCREHAAPFVLVIVPRSYQIYEAERAELLDALEISEQDLDLDRPQRMLNDWGGRNGVPVVDLLPAFRLYAGQNPGSNLYHYPDSHLNREGHQVAADAILSNEPAMEALRSGLDASELEGEKAPLDLASPVQ